MDTKHVTEITSLDQPEMISLLGVYLEEWKHRDTILWAQSFKFYYATIIIMLLPRLKFIGFDAAEFPAKLFPIVGLCMSIAFLYISWAYATRLDASGRTFNKVMNMFSENYQRYDITELWFKETKSLQYIFRLKIGYVFPFLMFISLIAIGISLLIL